MEITPSNKSVQPNFQAQLKGDTCRLGKEQIAEFRRIANKIGTPQDTISINVSEKAAKYGGTVCIAASINGKLKQVSEEFRSNELYIATMNGFQKIKEIFADQVEKTKATEIINELKKEPESARELLAVLVKALDTAEGEKIQDELALIIARAIKNDSNGLARMIFDMTAHEAIHGKHYRTCR